MMKLPGMGVLEKLKFFGSMFFLLKTNDWRPLDRISCKDWITKNAGKNVYEVLWKHLFEAKFGLHADEVPASWLWSRARRVAGSRKNLFSHERFGYFRNSSKSLLDSLEKYIISKNGRVLLQTRVDSVAAQEKGTVIITENGSKTEFDRVLLTVPIPEVKRISSQALGNYSKEFLNIEYCAITTLVLELKESFSEYFIINVCDSAVPFPAIIEFSNLRPKDETNGSNLIYIPNYVSCSSREYALNKDELLAHYMPYLKKINSKFDASKVLKSHVFKDDYAEAYMFRGYAEHVPGFSTPLKGVYIANSAQIYPWSKLVESSIGHAEKVSKEIIG